MLNTEKLGEREASLVLCLLFRGAAIQPASSTAWPHGENGEIENGEKERERKEKSEGEKHETTKKNRNTQTMTGWGLT